MPLKQGHGVGKPEISVVVGIGVGVAAVAGLAAGAALGTGMLAVGMATSRRNVKPALRAVDVKWDGEGRITNWPAVLKIVQQGGVEPRLRPLLWPFLLGVYPPGSTAAERAAELTRLTNLYTKLVLVCQELDTRVEAARRAALAAAERARARAAGALGLAAPSPEKAPLAGNLAAFAEAHRIIVLDAVRTDLRVQPSDVEPPPWAAAAAAASSHSSTAAAAASSSAGLLSSTGAAGGPQGNAATAMGASAVPTVTVLPVSVGEGLPELMLVDPPSPAPAEAVACGRVPLWRSPLAASTIEGASHAAPAARRLMLRLVNVLSAYAVHDPETGYCQGMADLAAAFVQLLADDALAFACFERLMRGARRNFRHDEAGIRAQLARVARVLADTDPPLFRRLEAVGAADCTFAYRMVLVMLRRELPLGEALTLWEVKWALEAGARGGRAGPGGGGGSGGAAPRQDPPASPLAATVASMDAATRAAVAEAKGNGTAAAAGGSFSFWSPVPAKAAAAAAASSAPARQQQRPPPPDFVLQFVAAAIRAERHRILAEAAEADDLLRLFNSVRIDFWTALAQARKQHKAYTQGIAVLERL